MIMTCTERAGWVYVVNEKGTGTAAIPAPDGLVGYTSTTVTVANGHYNYTYDEKGHRIRADYRG